jgi:hypothetical protein
MEPPRQAIGKALDKVAVIGKLFINILIVG